jgi:hypothetical protein
MNGGCNHMLCTQCGKYYCWGCGGKWETHANRGACPKFGASNSVIIEFKKERKVKTKTKYPRYANSLQHRKKRGGAERAALMRNVKRIMNTIRLSSLQVHLDDECKQFYSETELIVHENKLKEARKAEIGDFVRGVVAFVGELHFVCEHAYVLVQDRELEAEKRVAVRGLIKSAEIVIWLLENALERDTGVECVETLRGYQERGLGCMKRLRNLNLV